MRSTLWLLVLTLWLPLAAGAQCGTDDGLVGPCYQRTMANLPQFPPHVSLSKWIPFKDCQVDQVVRTRLTLPAPRQVACDYYVMQGVDLRDSATALPLWDPTALWIMHYTRTWMETTQTPTGPQRYQVWRFLINAEVRASQRLRQRYPTLASAPPHLVPACIYNGNGQPVHYSGYVDYALNCTTNRWEVAFGVQHACDVFTHNAFCKYPAGGHPNFSYTVVAPDTFTPDPTMPGISGPINAEAFRMQRFGSTWPLCETEQPIRQGAMQLGPRKCPCQSTTGNQFIEYVQKADTACRSSVKSISPFNALWGGSVQMSVGRFTGPGYPGPEILYFMWDPTIYVDGKTNIPSIELFVGIGTQRGWQMNPFQPVPGNPPTQQVDLQNVLLFPTLTGFSGMAGLFVSDKLLYYNF